MSGKVIGQSLLAGLIGALVTALAVFGSNPHGVVSDPLGVLAAPAATAAATTIGALLFKSPSQQK